MIFIIDATCDDDGSSGSGGHDDDDDDDEDTARRDEGNSCAPARGMQAEDDSVAAVPQLLQREQLRHEQDRHPQ